MGKETGISKRTGIPPGTFQKEEFEEKKKAPAVRQANLRASETTKKEWKEQFPID
jgi:hypothetical protein